MIIFDQLKIEVLLPLFDTKFEENGRGEAFSHLVWNDPHVKALLNSSKFDNKFFLVFRVTVQDNRGPPEGVLFVACGGRRGGGLC